MDSSETNNSFLLSQFHPAIGQWFEESFESPTPPQIKGWPPIFRGENTLILAPTGSGKTLAAFLVCINNLLKRLLDNNAPFGVHTLYISPLKALNYDIERNLEEPLTGIQQKSLSLKLNLPKIQAAVRTGDTPQKQRQQMLQKPPHILITTPESLHLLLTSLRAREILQTVQFVIVDEIHAISDNKRGTFLSLLLERLQNLCCKNFVRIGLSATQKPLEEIAKFLGGYEMVKQDNAITYIPRPVTNIDTGIRKELDLQIVSPVEDFCSLPEDTIWPDIYQKLLELIRNHRSTLIFTNNRAAAERITAEINDRASYELARAHHGSVSKTKRREIEEQLKQGRLPALVATATLELGIDMGAIDLVCQVESPKSIARGLQRVGRAGHLYKSASKGRLLPKTRADILEIAVITQAMHDGDVSPIKIPCNCLDILAQQVVAMVALKSWKIDDLYNLIRQAYPYQQLLYDHFTSVLEMLSGRYPADAFRELKPRISWDRVNNVLYPLPGSQRMAILGGGAISDTGQYGCYLEDGITKIGELEEEFIYERRLGEVFVLGTNSWRIKEITHDRVIVSPAPGEPARMPFWKGEYFNRDIHLGQLYGQFCRELSQQIESPECQQWLIHKSNLDPIAASNLYQYFLDQKEKAGTIPDDHTILIESFRDDMGDLRIAILTPFGGRLHLPWKLALLTQFRRKMNIEPESIHSDAGMLFRFPSENIDQIIQIIRSVTPQNLEDLIIEELANSAFFGLRFRQNAGRAMLLPKPLPGKRAPLWLQRMRARDLLEIARQYPSFPIVMETYRECLQDFLAINELKDLLQKIEIQHVQTVVRRAKAPSPFTSSFLFEFMAGYMYEYDTPKSYIDDSTILDKDFIQQLVHPDAVTRLLDADAVREIESRFQGEKEGYQARTASELVELLHRIGDLTEEEIILRVEGDWKLMLLELSEDRRIALIYIPEMRQPWRWITTEDFPLYRDAFADKKADSNAPESYQTFFIKSANKTITLPVTEVLPQELLSQKYDHIEAQTKIVERHIFQLTLISIEQIINRYPLKIPFTQHILDDLYRKKNFVKIQLAENESPHWAHRETVERIRRYTMAIQRRKIQPCDTTQFADFVLRWQHRTPETGLSGSEGVMTIIDQLQGLSLPVEIWENEIFARRIQNYRSSWLDELCSKGQIVWYGSTTGGSDRGALAFAFREDLHFFRFKKLPVTNDKIHQEYILKIRQVLQQLGACFMNDLSLETGLSPSACATALWEMIWMGEVTNDTFVVIRAGKPKIRSQNKYEYSQHRSAYRMLNHRHHYRPLAGSGRWSLLPPPNENKEISMEMLEALSRQLLQRYGLICRELYELEGWTLPWRPVYETLVHLEWRGEIRRGYFVKGLSGIQFALPQAAEELMSSYKKESKNSPLDQTTPQMMLINTCDPANLYGAASPLSLLHPLHPDWRLLRHPNNYLILKNGIPILAIEAKGTRLTPLRDLSPDETLDTLKLLPNLLDDSAGWRHIRSIKVETWNGQPVRSSNIVAILKEIGFRDEFKMMVLERNL